MAKLQSLETAMPHVFGRFVTEESFGKLISQITPPAWIEEAEMQILRLKELGRQIAGIGREVNALAGRSSCCREDEVEPILDALYAIGSRVRNECAKFFGTHGALCEFEPEFLKYGVSQGFLLPVDRNERWWNSSMQSNSELPDFALSRGWIFLWLRYKEVLGPECSLRPVAKKLWDGFVMWRHGPTFRANGDLVLHFPWGSNHYDFESGRAWRDVLAALSVSFNAGGVPLEPAQLDAIEKFDKFKAGGSHDLGTLGSIRIFQSKSEVRLAPALGAAVQAFISEHCNETREED